MHRFFDGFDFAGVADVGAAVGVGVAVEDFCVGSRFRDSDQIFIPGDRCEVEGTDECFGFILRDSAECIGTIRGIVGVNPGEAGIAEVAFMQCGSCRLTPSRVRHHDSTRAIVPVRSP